MAKTAHYHTQFSPNCFYHIYNRSIGKKPLFISDDNYRFFLKKYDQYLSSFLTTYAFALPGNHFHFMVKIKPFTEIGSPDELSFYEKLKSGNATAADLSTFQKLTNLNLHRIAPKLEPQELTPQDFATVCTHAHVSHQFQRFFQSYAMAFNKQQNRVGTLFQTPFKRCEVPDEAKRIRLLCYIHSNAQHHGLVPDFRTFAWTSFPRYLTENKASILPKDEVYAWFGGLDKFVAYHDLVQQELGGDLTMEDD